MGRSTILKSAESLWPEYSMLKTTISVEENIDISRFLKLKAFLKHKNDGYNCVQKEWVADKL